MVIEKRNELALCLSEIGMIRWMCCVKIMDKLSCAELRQQLGMEDSNSGTKKACGGVDMFQERIMMNG